MPDKPQSLQDLFLNSARRAKTPVTLFLMKGVKLQGTITWFDAFSLLLRREGVSQLVYKHAISTIMPLGLPPLEIAQGEGGSARRAALQDVFLEAAERAQEPMTVFLVNGVMLQGAVEAHDQFVLLLERAGQVQLVYKHAISTMQPASPLDLGSAEGRRKLSVFNRGDDSGIARGERALLVVPERTGQRVSDALRSTEARIEEAAGLAAAIGIDVVERRSFRLRTIRPASLFGKGQAEEIADLARADDLSLLLVDTILTPVQQKNLEELTKCKVIDRTGLILEIFGERAATAEGRLQVELAHLNYQAGRLVRSWTHLERQRGGFGFLGGPGETQIEADRRMIRDRMARIRKELDQVKRTRGLHRDRRQRAPWPVVALVGYTNAGKSTLFNRMTQSTVMAEDLLFATLDPTMRQMKIPGFDKAILSDTVGFVSDLPTELVAAFRATLEEVDSADLILHIRDRAHPDSEAQAADVEKVLASLGLSEEGSPPRLEVWNKIDQLGQERDQILGEAARRDDVIAVSALTGEGVDELREALAERLHSGSEMHHLKLGSGDGPRIAWLHARGEVLDQRNDGDTIHLAVKLSAENWERFQRL